MSFLEYINNQNNFISLENFNELANTSIIKSFSVGNGDLYYIKDHAKNFTIIDCNLIECTKKELILQEIKKYCQQSNISRFISTHPDQDHICGIKEIIKSLNKPEFYFVKNNILKSEETEDFKYYKLLRQLYKNRNFISTRLFKEYFNTDNYLNSNQQYQNSNFKIIWPNVENINFKEALNKANKDGEPNNISPIIYYRHPNSTSFIWMGDLETDFLKKIEANVNWPQVDVIFAPHHGRDSGAIPKSILNKLSPKIIVIGVAPSNNLYYEYKNICPTITQNSAGDITFEVSSVDTKIYSSEESYILSENYQNLNIKDRAWLKPIKYHNGYYIGKLERKS